jgi:hypothetical protein
MTLENTIVAGNTAGSAPSNCAVAGGPIASMGHDIESSNSCGFTAAGDHVNTDPVLGPLRNNGGPTPTQALSAGSPAIDAGDTARCASTDQRGVARPQGPACDIGAFELASPAATTGAATGVGTTFATLSGSGRNPDVVGGSVFFQFGTSPAYGYQTPAQALGAGGTASFSAALVGLPSGTVIHFREVATNPDGTSFGADHAFMTLPSAVLLPSSISGASLTHKRFRVSRQATPISATARTKAPLGTRFRFTLSAAAKLTIAITRSAPGLRRGHSCVAPTAKLRRTHAKRCGRTLRFGTLTRSREPGGADSVAFSGRVGHRPLSPGVYTALLSASNAGGPSKPVTLTFTVVR